MSDQLQFVLFGGSRFYPSGGWEDYEGSFETVVDAVRYVADGNHRAYDWWHVVDLTTGRIVAEKGPGTP